MALVREEQYAAVKFCVRLQKSATEAYRLLQQAYSKDVLSKATAFQWFKQFKEGSVSITKQGGPGPDASHV